MLRAILHNTTKDCYFTRDFDAPEIEEVIEDAGDDEGEEDGYSPVVIVALEVLDEDRIIKKPQKKEYSVSRDEFYPIFDILPELWNKGYTTVEQEGLWHLFDKHGEGVLSGKDFRQLCINIVLAGY